MYGGQGDAELWSNLQIWINSTHWNKSLRSSKKSGGNGFSQICFSNVEGEEFWEITHTMYVRD